MGKIGQRKFMRVCTKCQVLKEVTEFYTRPKTRLGITSSCKQCQINYGRKYWIQRQQKAIKKRRLVHTGCTDTIYTTLLQEQNNSCAICKKSRQLLDRDLAADHDHVTGKVRGLLCAKCNLALGLLTDNTQVLVNAINYLNRSMRAIPCESAKEQ